MDWNAILSSGVFAQGVAALVWAVRLEMRVQKLERA
jgi:hypothetical protein